MSHLITSVNMKQSKCWKFKIGTVYGGGGGFGYGKMGEEIVQLKSNKK